MTPAEPESVALSAWKVLPRQTVIGKFHFVPLTVHDSAPSLSVAPAAIGCMTQLPVEWDVAQMAFMPAEVGKALA